MDPRLASILVQDVLEKKSEKARSARPVNILSKRELQVLRLVARGYTSAAIAKQIFVGVKTIETYRSRIAEKLGLRTRDVYKRQDLRRFFPMLKRGQRKANSTCAAQMEA